ncbi:MAG: hypothetical protein WD448_06950 [Woeseia sp.]
MDNGTAQHDDDRAVDDEGRDFIARKHRFPANAAGFLLAPVVWFAYFIVIYALQGTGCAVGLDQSSVAGVGTLRLLLLLATLAAVVSISLSGYWSFRSWYRLLHELEEEEKQVQGHSAFLAYGALLHAGLFLIATLWIGVPILLMDSCDALGST